jgi:hypothetical protein
VLMRAGDDDQVRKRRLVLGITHAVRNCSLPQPSSGLAEMLQQHEVT